MNVLSASVCAWLVLAAGAAADEIHLYNGKPKDDVTIVDETYEVVVYKIAGVRTDQTLPADQVKEVVHDEASFSDEYQRALVNLGEGDYKTAAMMFEAAAGKPPRPWIKQYALFNAAECRRALREYDAALAAYDRLLTEVPKTRFFGDCHVKKALVYQAKGDAAKARATFEELQQAVQQKGVPVRWGVVASYHLLRMDSSKDPAKAIQAYEELQRRAAELGAKDVANLARLSIGTQLIKQQKIADARRYFQEIIADRQASDTLVVAGAYNGLGSTYVSSPKPSPEDWTEALFAYARTVFHYGEELQRLGDQQFLPEAMYWTARALRERTQNAETNQKRADWLVGRLADEYPSSEWTQRAYERR